MDKDQNVYAENQIVKFKYMELEGSGKIKGRTLTWYSYDFYIIEIIESNIDKSDYPYSCIQIPSTYINKIC